MLAPAALQLIVIISVIQKSGEECRNDSSTKCCADFYFEDGTCKPCRMGYFGPNCEKKCPYPKYGRKCVDGECNCSQEQCDVAVGCLKEMPDVSTPARSVHISAEKASSQNTPPIVQTAESEGKTVENSYDSKQSDSGKGNPARSAQLSSMKASSQNTSTIVQTTVVDIISQGRMHGTSDLEKSDNKSDIVLVVILSTISSLVISASVIVIFVCLQTRKSTRIRSRKGKTSQHNGRASTASYHEIDDRVLALHRLSEGKYEKIDVIDEESETIGKHNYETLPQQELSESHSNSEN